MSEISEENIRDQLRCCRNVVSEAALSCEFPDLLIPAMLCLSKTEPRLFPASVARFVSRTENSTGCTISIFARCRAMCMGSGSVFDSRLALEELCALINRTIPGMHCRVTFFRVVNMVASVALGIDLDMERLAHDWKWSGIWEKTSFPGFKLEMQDLRCTFVVFPSQGKVNIAGIKKPRLIPKVAKRMRMFPKYHKP